MVYHAFHLTSKDWLLLTPLNFNTQSNEGGLESTYRKKKNDYPHIAEERPERAKAVSPGQRPG